MRIKINTDFASFKAGSIIIVDEINGIPTERYWRRRLADSKIDNCCEVLTESKPKPEAKADKRKKTTKGES